MSSHSWVTSHFTSQMTYSFVHIPSSETTQFPCQKGIDSCSLYKVPCIHCRDYYYNVMFGMLVQLQKPSMNEASDPSQKCHIPRHFLLSTSLQRYFPPLYFSQVSFLYL